MRNNARVAMYAALFSIASPAHGDFATFVIDELYSNADGNVQYVVLHEAQDDEQHIPLMHLVINRAPDPEPAVGQPVS